MNLKMATAMLAEMLDNFQTFDAAHPRKPKLHIELQSRKHKDKNVYLLFNGATSILLIGCNNRIYGTVQIQMCSHS
jgi:hypothetical protein